MDGSDKRSSKLNDTNDQRGLTSDGPLTGAIDDETGARRDEAADRWSKGAVSETQSGNRSEEQADVTAFGAE